jgi:hypothetical protein
MALHNEDTRPLTRCELMEVTELRVIRIPCNRKERIRDSRYRAIPLGSRREGAVDKRIKSLRISRAKDADSGLKEERRIARHGEIVD